MIVTFDVETTVKHKGAPFTKSNRCVCYAAKVADTEVKSSYFTDIDFPKLLRESFSQAKLLVGFNVKFDLHWARRLGVLPPDGVRIWDCQIAEFLIRGQQGSYPSLNESLARFDLGQKDDRVAEYWDLGIETTDIPADELRFYNNLDVELTHKLYLKQREVMPAKLQRLCMVMGLDLLVLAEMEWNGLKVDIELCKSKADETKDKLQALTAELHQILGCSAFVNLDSGHQLSCLLYGGSFELTRVIGYESLVYKTGAKKGQAYERAIWETTTVDCKPIFSPIKGSETKLVSKANGSQYPVYTTGEDVLKQLKAKTKASKRIIAGLLERAEQAKLLDTYFGAIPTLIEKMEWEDKCLHGSFNQCVARTGRLSSKEPNVQNFSGAVDEILVSRY